ncbi:UNVERIFIED_CONTAM: hypothetical protein Sangu_0748200 [Sesamum angustifolium]|uniref:Uncharacterized protein n=1 Tax=Sesamum angustifolium TaxID=2727405 RepID=A0AAW2PUG2_9LAMI
MLVWAVGVDAAEGRPRCGEKQWNLGGGMLVQKRTDGDICPRAAALFRVRVKYGSIFMKFT